MKFSALKFAVASCVLALASSAQAGIVYLNPLVVQKITDLSIGTEVYDVTFADRAFDATFMDDPDGALAAAMAIIEALNGTTAPFLDFGAGAIDNFTVLTSRNFIGLTGASGQVAKNWQVYGIGYFGSTAQFQKVASVPEPLSVALIGLGLAGMVLTRRKIQ